MRVLVTGATGFIGAHLITHLLQRGHEVIALARCRERAAAMPWIGQVRFVEFDIQRDAVGILTDMPIPDAVAHLAWQGLPNYGELFHYEHNLPADYRFLKDMLALGVRQLLVTGTCFEYGMQSGCLAEDGATDPGNPYALAKDTLRRFLQQLQKKQPFLLQWARMFYLHGPGQNAKSILSQLDAALDDGQTTFNMSGGEQLRDYLSVEQASLYLASLIESAEDTGVINVCSGKPITIRRLVEEHMSKRGKSLTLNLGHYPYSSFEPMAFWGDNRRLAAVLARGPKHGAQE